MSTELTNPQLAERYIIQAKNSAISYEHNFAQGRIPEAQWTQLYRAITFVDSEMMNALNFPPMPEVEIPDYNDENINAMISQACTQFVQSFHAAFPDGKVETMSKEDPNDQIDKIQKFMSARNRLMSMLEVKQTYLHFEGQKAQSDVVIVQ